MNQLHQIYGTHCTYSTSAIEKRTGEMAERVLGYSARASSLDTPGELRQYYRAVERFTYYYLQSDIPPDQKAVLTAVTAPKRLVYHPSSGGLQMVTQVCYRQFDCAGRPGSYFAHVLVQKQSEEPILGVLDSLRLYAAPGWTTEEPDDQSFGHRLPALNGLSTLYRGQPPAIDDELFSRFLTSPQEKLADIKLLPARWRNMPLERRCQLFLSALQGYLSLAKVRSRDQFLLLIEPEASVFFFYGILRLLPSLLRDGLSFSTFEANPDRLCTTLAALHFHDASRDIRPERYNRGFVLNTFSDNTKSTPLQNPPAYAISILDKLFEHGWEAVDRTHFEFEQLRMKEVRDLDELTELDSLTSQIIDPRAHISDPSWRSRVNLRNLQWKVGERLSNSQSTTQLDALVEAPEHLYAVLDLIASEDAPQQWNSSTNYLLARLPQSEYANFFKASKVAVSHKLKLLSSYVKQYARVPPNCSFLWTELRGHQNSGRYKDSTTLLIDVLREVPYDKLQELWRNTPEHHRLTLFISVLDTTQYDLNRRSFLHAKIGTLTEDQLYMLASERAEALIEDAAGYKEGGFDQRLLKIFDKIPEKPKRFETRLDLLKRMQAFLPDNYHDRLDAWEGISNLLGRARQPAGSKNGTNSAANLPIDPSELSEKLAVLIVYAIPVRGSTATEEEAVERSKILRHLAEGLDIDMIRFGRTFASLSVYIHNPFARHRAASVRAQTRRRRFDRNLVIGGIIATLFLAIAVWYALMPSSTETDLQIATESSTPPAMERDEQTSTHEAQSESRYVNDNRTEGQPRTESSSPDPPKIRGAEAQEINSAVKAVDLQPPNSTTESSSSGDAAAADIVMPDESQSDSKEQANAGRIVDQATQRAESVTHSDDKQEINDQSHAPPVPIDPHDLEKPGRQSNADAIDESAYMTAVTPDNDFDQAYSRRNGTIDLKDIADIVNDGARNYTLCLHGLAAFDTNSVASDASSKVNGDAISKAQFVLRSPSGTTKVALEIITPQTPNNRGRKLAEFFIGGDVMKCLDTGVKTPEAAEWRRQSRFCAIELKPNNSERRSTFIALYKPHERKPEDQEWSMRCPNGVIGGLIDVPWPARGAPVRELFLGRGYLMRPDGTRYEFGRDAAFQEPALQWSVDRLSQELGLRDVRISMVPEKLRLLLHPSELAATDEYITNLRAYISRISNLSRIVKDRRKTNSERVEAALQVAEITGLTVLRPRDDSGQPVSAKPQQANEDDSQYQQRMNLWRPFSEESLKMVDGPVLEKLNLLGELKATEWRCRAEIFRVISVDDDQVRIPLVALPAE